METTISEITHRLEKLENEVRSIRHEYGDGRHPPLRHRDQLTPAEWGALAMEDAERNAEYYRQIFAQALTEMGIVGEPIISPDELFRLYEDAGMDPNGTEFAQGIVAMREE
ncbi:MAG: hypothetical protein ONB44_22765 [candidate division KSB1 bacterium]|nr:hypothetical protein [candidate division KSB1 bacterium]MDZ7304961.1 hypothetical protein [candidate division KSB1 bacterium]MDZ7314006.1 hypothetical protein [candidate division KSB1 bacterium]